MRVIAGSLGGRRLVAPRGLATRPTSDRVREASFSRLGDVRGLRVLDLFAGTGALGIEALSRGAATATFVESARPALAALRANVDGLGLADRVTILGQPAARAIAALTVAGARFDLVFLDPPYAELAAAAEVLSRAVERGLLDAEGRALFEHAARDPAPSVAGLVAEPARIYGDTAVTIYARASEES